MHNICFKCLYICIIYVVNVYIYNVLYVLNVYIYIYMYNA